MIDIVGTQEEKKNFIKKFAKVRVTGVTGVTSPLKKGVSALRPAKKRRDRP
jgi:hypothetical protein